MTTQVRVHNPMGYPPHIAQKRLAPRPADLRGKTVYLVDCRFDDGDILVEQMANMISASRSYQSNVAVVNASKQMLLRTLALGQ